MDLFVALQWVAISAEECSQVIRFLHINSAGLLFGGDIGLY